MKEYGSDPATTFALVRGLQNSSSRQIILKDNMPWEQIWKPQLNSEDGALLLEALSNEIQFHLSGQTDEDIAYSADIASRIKAGQIVTSPNDKLTSHAAALLKRPGEIYPGISDRAPIRKLGQRWTESLSRLVNGLISWLKSHGSRKTRYHSDSPSSGKCRRTKPLSKEGWLQGNNSI